MAEKTEENGLNKDLIDEIEELIGKEAADKVQDIKHGGGILGGGKAGYENVIKLLIKAAQDPDKDYRQALILAAFLDREDATVVVSALDERKRYGVDITPVVDLITAWAAVEGARGGRAGLAVEAQTHQSVTTNLPGALKRSFFNKGKKGKDEPLS